MKLKEIIKNLDKSEKNSSYVDVSEMLNDMGINGFISKESEKLKAYYFFNWYCTDSYVGGRAYFLDDVLVATSWQRGRKCDEKMFWISTEAYNSVKTYLLSLLDDIDEPNLDIVDLEAEWDDGHHVEYGCQLLTDIVIHEPTRELVKIIKRYHDMNDSKKWKIVKIGFDSGENKEVPLTDILVPYNLIKK